MTDHTYRCWFQFQIVTLAYIEMQLVWQAALLYWGWVDAS